MTEPRARATAQANDLLADVRPLHPIVPGCTIAQYLDQLDAIETLASALASGAHVDNGTQWASVRRLHEMTEMLLAWTTDDRGVRSGTARA